MVCARDAPDLNILVSGLLDDLAGVQTSVHPRRAYARVARQIALLPERLSESTVPTTLGRTAATVIREVLATGASASVERAVALSGRREEVERRRARRDGFLSLAAARLVLEDGSLDGVGLDDYLGDLQMHTQWSDGRRSITDMVIACADRGYTHLAVTDHAVGLSVARGVTAAGLRAQAREIADINDAAGGRFVVIPGLEANILADGTVDAPADAPALVLAAPHSKLDSDEDQTPRLIRAVSTPGVSILAHPGGRKFGARAGLQVDWPRVFAAAAHAQVAIEIDGDPSRQDLPGPLARQACDAGCLIAIDSDAHDTGDLAFVEIGLAHARLAGIPASRVINTWSADALLHWLHQRR